MADEPDDTDPDLLRDRLLLQVERGEITKQQAEEAATARGLEPFERRPELPRFDPRLKSHWSIVMAVAWIARRDFDLVREQDPEFCSECFHWRYREWKERAHKAAKSVKRTGYFLEERRPPTVSRLALLDVVSRVRGNVPSNAVMTMRKARDALWGALSEGHLISEGINIHGTVVEIPSREWAHLRLFDDRGRESLRYARGKTEPFIAVTFRRSDLLRLWPAATGELPAAKVDKGGRPAEYDWAAIKEFAVQQVKIYGKPGRNNKRMPSKAQLIEQIQRECGARFGREPPTSSLRSYLNHWLDEMDGN